MAQDLLLDDTGDVVMAGNQVQLVEGDAEIAQAMKLTLAVEQGEFEPNPSQGLSHDNLFGKDVVPEFVEQDIEDAIGQEPRIDQVTDVEVEQPDADRVATITVTATSPYIEGDTVTTTLGVNTNA